jgi:hypothetical protein
MKTDIWVDDDMLMTVTFVTYALTGHDLNPGSIFAALALFNVIRFPIQVSTL